MRLRIGTGPSSSLYQVTRCPSIVSDQSSPGSSSVSESWFHRANRSVQRPWRRYGGRCTRKSKKWYRSRCWSGWVETKPCQRSWTSRGRSAGVTAGSTRECWLAKCTIWVSTWASQSTSSTSRLGAAAEDIGSREREREPRGIDIVARLWAMHIWDSRWMHTTDVPRKNLTRNNFYKTWQEKISKQLILCKLNWLDKQNWKWPQLVFSSKCLSATS